MTKQNEFEKLADADAVADKAAVKAAAKVDHAAIARKEQFEAEEAAAAERVKYFAPGAAEQRKADMLATEASIVADQLAAKKAAEETPAKLAPIELVAAVRGFYDGAMVEADKTFLFDPTPSKVGDPPRKNPKWAAPAGQVAAFKKPPDPKAFDTRPIAAQKAAAAKAGLLSRG